jgi:hypothetical protein
MNPTCYQKRKKKEVTNFYQKRKKLQGLHASTTISQLEM